MICPGCQKELEMDDGDELTACDSCEKFGCNACMVDIDEEIVHENCSILKLKDQ